MMGKVAPTFSSSSALLSLARSPPARSRAARGYVGAYAARRNTHVAVTATATFLRPQAVDIASVAPAPAHCRSFRFLRRPSGVSATTSGGASGGAAPPLSSEPSATGSRSREKNSRSSIEDPPLVSCLILLLSASPVFVLLPFVLSPFTALSSARTWAMTAAKAATKVWKACCSSQDAGFFLFFALYSIGTAIILCKCTPRPTAAEVKIKSAASDAPQTSTDVPASVTERRRADKDQDPILFASLLASEVEQRKRVEAEVVALAEKFEKLRGKYEALQASEETAALLMAEAAARATAATSITLNPKP